MLNILKTILTVYLFLLLSSKSYSNSIGSDTSYKIPRFVSLKSNEVNLRIGSSINYPIKLQYISKNLPVQIIEEYDVWRKVEDIDGNIGWIHKALLKGDRYGIINHKNDLLLTKIYKKPDGKHIGEIGNKNIVKINMCLLDWCKISHNKNKGWVSKKYLWGIQKIETFNIPFYHFFINLLWETH